MEAERWELACSIQYGDSKESISGTLLVEWNPLKISQNHHSMFSIELPLLEDHVLSTILEKRFEIVDEDGTQIAKQVSVLEIRNLRGIRERKTVMNVICDAFMMGQFAPVQQAVISVHVPMAVWNFTVQLGRYVVDVQMSPIHSQVVLIKVRAADGSTLDYTEVLKAAESVSDLIRYAQGVTTSWSRIDGYSDVDSNVYTNLHIPFIEFTERHLVMDLESFLTQTFVKYYEMLDEEREIWREFHDYIVHALNSQYPVPFMLLYSAVEMVSSSPLIVDWKQTSFAKFSKSEREEFKASLGRWLRAEGINIPEEDLDGKVRQLLLRNFKPRARAVFETYGIHLPEELLQKFNARRNDTHNGYTYQHGDNQVSSRFIGYMEQLLLRRLEFKGEVEDYTQTGW
jgi:hypothetical protein